MENKFGHQRKNPRFFEPPSSNRRLPFVLEIAKRTLERFYDDPTRWLPDLEVERVSATTRKIRSEQREAVALVLGVVLQLTELSNLEIGYWQAKTEEVAPISILRIASYAGMHYKRCQRALKLLRDAGYLIWHEQPPLDCARAAIPAVKQVHPKLLFHLGVTSLQLQEAQHYARKKLEKKVVLHTMLKDEFHKINRSVKLCQSEPIVNADLIDQQRRQRYDRIRALRRRHPDLGLNKV